MKKHMQIPQPKVLIPALFAVVAGIPMMLQTTIGPMNMSASLANRRATGAAEVTAAMDADTKYDKAVFLCLQMRREGSTVGCPKSVDDPAVQTFLDMDTTVEAAPVPTTAVPSTSTLSYVQLHLLRNAQRVGSCDNVLRSVSESLYMLCKRTLSEMNKDRSDTITEAIKRTQRARVHSAAPDPQMLNNRLKQSTDAKPENASETKRFRYRRDGSMTLPQDE